MFELQKQSVEYENKSLRMPRELIDKVQKLANNYNMSFNKVVIKCIEYSLDNMKSENREQKTDRPKAVPHRDFLSLKNIGVVM